MHSEVAYVKAAFRLGASGYLVKRTAADELPSAIRAVLDGHWYLTPLLTSDALREFLAASPNEDSPNIAGDLTSRQREVLQMICEGRSTKEIAHVLGISTKTVLFHKYRIMEELGLNTVAELTQYAMRQGIVSA
jgi:DNA-binding NarL/FixJ family response regulator